MVDDTHHATRAEALWLAFGILFVVAALVLGEAARAAGGGRAGLVAAQATCTAMAFAVPQLRQWRSSRAEASAEEREIEARVETRMAINDALDPVLRMVGRSVAEPDREVRERLAAQTVSLVLKTASEFIGPDRSRACWFRLDAGPPGRLVPEEHAGRAGPPATHFVEGSIAGDAAIALVLSDGALRCEDVATDPPAGWSLDRDPAYRTFVAVATVGDGAAYGMLTLDALEPGSLSADDEGLLRLVSGVLSLAMGLTDRPEATS